MNCFNESLNSGSTYTGADGLCSAGYTGDVSYGGCSETHGGCRERSQRAYGTVDETKEKGCDAKRKHRKASDKKDGDGDKELIIEKKEWS